jgi:signal peptidase II
MTRRRIQMILLFVLVLVADQVTKVLAARLLDGREPVELVGGVLSLHYAENPGAFLSLGAGLSPQSARDKSAGLTRAVAVTLIVAGGVGNVIDRIAMGVVRDFAIVGVPSVPWLRTGVFNVADLGITTGVVLLAFEVWLKKRRARREAQAPSPASATEPTPADEPREAELP